MSIVLIVILLVVAVIVAASIALGRTAYEVDSARDTEYVELEGSWIRYDIIGGGPPVVLVHGWLSSSRVWDQLAGRLAQRFTVYTLDLSGFGESDKPLSGYGVRNGSRLLYAFCAQFGLTRASIIGHDIGGAMAVKLAADHPDIAGRLVLVATPANEEQIDLPTALWLATIPVLGPLFYSLGRVFRPLRSLWMRPFVLDSNDLTDDVIDDAAMSTPAAATKSLAVTRREIAGGRLARQTRMIKVPILIIAGEEDQIVDPQAVSVWTRGADQAEVVLMNDCGHMPMLERTSEFNAQVLAFLTGDGRYLDYVEETREANDLDDEDFDQDDHLETTGETAGESSEPAETRGSPAPVEAFDETSEEPPVEQETGEGRPRRRVERFEPRESRPGVTRKEGGRYPARNHSSSFGSNPSDNGIEDRPSPRAERRDVFERESPGLGGKGDIPDVPEDLFDWSRTRREPRSRERNLEDRDNYETPGAPEDSRYP
jgi:pimeloyl-ACP methyl ester carboxylesterase